MAQIGVSHRRIRKANAQSGATRGGRRPCGPPDDGAILCSKSRVCVANAQAPRLPSSSSGSALRTVLVELGECLVAEFVEIAAVDRCADIVEQFYEEVLVVNRRQRETVEFAGTQRMVHVCARIVRAGVAVAVLLKWAEIVLELCALDVVAAVAREDRTIAAATRGGHAVEGVAAVLHAGEDVVHRRCRR